MQWHTVTTGCLDTEQQKSLYSDCAQSNAKNGDSFYGNRARDTVYRPRHALLQVDAATLAMAIYLYRTAAVTTNSIMYRQVTPQA